MYAKYMYIYIYVYVYMYVHVCMCMYVYMYMYVLEKEMATHSSVLAWRIQWTEKPGRLQSMGSHRVGDDWSDLAAYVCIYTYIWCIL